MMRRLFTALVALILANALALAQTTTPLPVNVTAGSVVDLGAGPLNVRVLQGNVLLFTGAGGAACPVSLGAQPTITAAPGASGNDIPFWTTSHVCATVPLGPSAVVLPYVTTLGSLTPTIVGSAASGVVLKAAPGSLISVYADCTAACWLMIFNSATIPANGPTTAGTASGNMQSCIPVGANGIASVSYVPGPYMTLSVGITVAISSTPCATLTLSPVAFIHGVTI